MWRVTEIAENKVTLETLSKLAREYDKVEEAIEFYTDRILFNKSDEYRVSLKNSVKAVTIFLVNDKKIVDHRYFVYGHYA